MEHQKYEELLTLHALDALDAAEKRALEAHLDTCSVCRTELIEMRDVAGLIAHASTPAEPPMEVRASILNEIHRETGRRQSVAETAAPVVPFRARSATSPWPNLLRLAAAIAFMALLIGVVVLWRRDARSRQEIARLSQQLTQQQEELSRDRDAFARQREALALLNTPGMKKMELTGTQTAANARATFVYDRATGRAMLMTNGLPAAPAGMAYEVWFIPKGHSPMPGKTFTVDAAGHAMMMDEVPAEARENAVIAITLEPESGSASPTGAIYLSSPAS
jgi:anti-sigma-K factor RskA